MKISGRESCDCTAVMMMIVQDAVKDGRWTMCEYEKSSETRGQSMKFYQYLRPILELFSADSRAILELFSSYSKQQGGRGGVVPYLSVPFGVALSVI
ncbi:predicted protein [Botrytis cinerea T4]|uniref:Uncharacterized protein n=1 Tax=Botryotinia fuckeliana (strain T4) TaxID=999810 RepID=G2YQS8_BOTF4|nr:predicted protein [Botrytis cinerea T4]